jgi:ABC-type lipoprotein export system ATPase subunit
MSAIAAKDLFYIYRASHRDVAALRGLSLQVGEGEVVSVLGPSGSGKTTLLALCAGALHPSSGELAVLGVDSGRRGDLVSHRRRSIGIVRQHYHRSLPRDLSVEEIVALPLRFLGLDGSVARRRATDLLSSAGLGRQREARTFELSGGEQQRVAVCAALAKSPRLVLADEPTGELDAAASTVVMDLLLELAARSGAAALIVTHDEEVAFRTPRTIHVRDGRLAAEGLANPVLILDEQGGIRVPERLRVAARLGHRVRASIGVGGLILSPEDDSATTADPGPAPSLKVDRAASGRQGSAPSRVALSSLSKSFGLQDVLAGFSHVFEPGRLHVIAGPSGSGKTTALNLIAALEAPDGGTVRVDGTRVDRLERNQAALWRQRTLGYLSQHSELAESLSARENVELALLLRGAGAEEARAGAEWALSWVGLEKLGGRPANRLSGGEQRRVGLARALAPSPSLLIADEPTAHLDRFTGRMIIALLHEAARAGTTVIAASHDPDLIAAGDETCLLPGARVAETRGRPGQPTSVPPESSK